MNYLWKSEYYNVNKPALEIWTPDPEICTKWQAGKNLTVFELIYEKNERLPQYITRQVVNFFQYYANYLFIIVFRCPRKNQSWTTLSIKLIWWFYPEKSCVLYSHTWMENLGSVLVKLVSSGSNLFEITQIFQVIFSWNMMVWKGYRL